MGRDQVIQQLLYGITNPSYLEIGVQNGYTFHSVTAASKVAVDPHFAFDVEAAKQDAANTNCAYYEMTSDDYFERFVNLKTKFDFIFIDGLHTFEQTLRDLLNSTALLNEGGIIVIDDVMPVTYASAISDIVHFSQFREAMGFADGSWMGDVYKLVFFIRYYMPLFSFATVAENHGQTVMWRQARALDASQLKVEAVTRLDFSDVQLSKQAFNILPFADIVALTRSMRACYTL